MGIHGRMFDSIRVSVLNMSNVYLLRNRIVA